MSDTQYEVVQVSGATCDSCGHMMKSEDVEENPVYECQNDGTRWTRDSAYSEPAHRCPDCNKFASRVADNGCPECGEGEMVDSELWMIEGDDSEELYETEEDAKEALKALEADE